MYLGLATLLALALALVLGARTHTGRDPAVARPTPGLANINPNPDEPSRGALMVVRASRVPLSL